MGSRANDQSGTYIICLFYPALFTLSLKGGEERNSVADGPFYISSTDMVLHFIGDTQANKYSQQTSGQQRLLLIKTSSPGKDVQYSRVKAT